MPRPKLNYPTQDTTKTTPLSKVCPACEKDLPLTSEHYYFQKNGYPQAYCIPCLNKRSIKYQKANPHVPRAAHLRRFFGITIADYERLYEKQNGRCAICGRTADAVNNKANYLSVDHSHTTGVVRGLLCHHCNLALGQFQDDIELLKKAIKYLRKKTA